MSHLSIDTAWCPVCDRAILPKRIQVPVHDPQTVRKHFRQQHGRGSRKNIPPSSEEPARMRTIISQEPAPYYCSEECRLRELQSELEALHLSPATPFHHQLASEDLDEPFPLRVPHNTPCDSRSPPSPALAPSSGTDSDDSADSYSPSQVLRNLPPLRRKPSKKATDPKCGPEFTGGAMMAARRIQAAFATASEVCLPSSVRRPTDIPGWTDNNDRTSWRAAVYAGSKIDPSNGKYTSIDASDYTGGSFSAQAARRIAGEQEPPKRVVPPAGQSAPQFSVRPPQSQFKPAFRRTESSLHISSSPKNISVPTPPEESVHPLLSHSSLRGKLLIPHLRTPSSTPSRSESASDLTAFSAGCTHTHRSSKLTVPAEQHVSREWMSPHNSASSDHSDQQHHTPQCRAIPYIPYLHAAPARSDASRTYGCPPRKTGRESTGLAKADGNEGKLKSRYLLKGNDSSPLTPSRLIEASKYQVLGPSH
jgi:hypothetical protein